MDTTEDIKGTRSPEVICNEEDGDDWEPLRDGEYDWKPRRSPCGFCHQKNCKQCNDMHGKRKTLHVEECTYILDDEEYATHKKQNTICIDDRDDEDDEDEWSELFQKAVDNYAAAEYVSERINQPCEQLIIDA